LFKKLILVVILAAGAYLAYDRFLAKSEAYAAYQEFATAMATEKWDEAQHLAAGQSVVDQIDEQRRALGVLGQGAYREARGVIHWGPKFELISETYSENGTRATLKVIQVERRGPYMMAPVGPATVRHEQTVIMARTDSGWVVEDFDEEVTPMEGRP
jgi:hypothetical protein